MEKGIEIDLINEYVFWLKAKEKITLIPKYKKFDDFNAFYNSIKKGGKNTIGLGSVTVTKERTNDVDFTASYLKNVAFCISSGNAPDIKTKNPQEVMKALGKMKALTMQNTSLEKYIKDLKKSFLPDLKTVYHPSETKILDEIARSYLYFGYVDAISFWFYLRTYPQKFLKIQKTLNQSKEEFALIVPKDSKHKVLFNEFFASPKGFSHSPKYRGILESHLGSYMAMNVAIN